MVNALKKEISKVFEYLDKEREWLLAYGNTLEEVQGAVTERDTKKINFLLRKLAFDEKRIHRFQNRVKFIVELFEKEFLTSKKGNLLQLEEQLTLYGNLLLKEVSRGLLGLKGEIPSLLKRKPIPWGELQKEINHVSEKIIAPFLVVIYDLQEEVHSLSQQYAQRRKNLATELHNVRATEYPVFRTLKGDVESDLSFSFAALIKELSKWGKTVRILDLGCGEGTCLKQLYLEYGRKVELHGLSIMREEAWTPQAIHWHVGHVEKISKMFPKNYFDLIYSHLGAFTHGTNLVKAVYQCSLILKSGGILIFNTINWNEEMQRKTAAFFQPSNGRNPVVNIAGFSFVIHFKRI